MTTPGRDAQRVANVARDGWSGDAMAVSIPDVLMLLRAERARLRRVVKKLQRQMKAASDSTKNPLAVRTYCAPADTCELILAALARGKR